MDPRLKAEDDGEWGDAPAKLTVGTTQLRDAARTATSPGTVLARLLIYLPWGDLMS